MLFIVATNVVASQPPKRRLTGTLTARAISHTYQNYSVIYENPIGWL